ncbi:THO complex, subunit THOC1 [Yarrowia lipolytica]|nr:THO complex, subunit THOC1 [Yarrowia lipolytica]
MEKKLVTILDKVSGHYKTDYTRLESKTIEKSGFRQWCEKYMDANPTDNLDNIFRQVMFEKIMLQPEDKRGRSLAALLDCITYESQTTSSDEKPLLESTLTLALVEDIFDIHTVDWCRHFWTHYLVSREEQLMNVSRNQASSNSVTRPSGRKAPGTTLIRLANALLRRVSKSRDAVFAGEILIFLSRAFPLSERSGLNQKGEFNVENITVFEGYEGAKEHKEVDEDEDDDEDDNEDDDEDENENEDKDVDMGVDEMKEKVKEKTATPATSKEHTQEPSDSPYALFWGLQKYFADPTILLNSKEPEVEMNKLQTCLKATVKTLRSHDGSTEIAQGGGTRWAKRDSREGGNRGGNTSAAGGGSGGSRDFGNSRGHSAYNHSSRTLNAKWLTNPDLFTLQLSDTNFRRAIWTQILIFSEFMLSLTEKNKAKIPATATNRSVQYQYTLSAADEIYFESVVAHFESSGKNKPPYKPGHSPDFNAVLSRIIPHVFKFDEKWVEWKLENCPAYEKPVMNNIDEVEGVEELITKLGHVRPRWRYEMGTEALTKIMAVECGLSLLEKKPDLPSIGTPQVYIDKLSELDKVRKLDWDFLDEAEQAKCLEDISAADWLGWRAARVGGLWSKLGEATVLNEVVNGAKDQKDTRESVDIEEGGAVEVEEEADEEAEAENADTECIKRPLEESEGDDEGTPSKKIKKDEEAEVEPVAVQDSDSKALSVVKEEAEADA